MREPSGAVTFLFTDIEGSTSLWERAPREMRVALGRHDVLLRTAFAKHGGYVFATGGDGFAVAFEAPLDAVAAAVDAQRALRSEVWPGDAVLRVRMGLHTGTADERDGDYFGPTVNRAARVMATAHGGQIVMTGTAAARIEPTFDGGIVLEDAGMHRLKGLQRPEQILHVIVDDVSHFPALRSLDREHHNLPPTRTTLVGRRAELEQLAGLLRPGGLVTLVGPGGVGKTRVALEHASATADDWRDGAWLVELSDLTDDSRVPDALLGALGLPVEAQSSGRGVRAAEKIAGWSSLVVLDNCEHVIDGAAETADEILARCPEVALLATSREALAVEGEQVVRLGGLEGDSGDSARLFVDSAQRADPRYEPTAGELAAIENVCAGLDHLPLAIELAAARAPQLGLDNLIESLLSPAPVRRGRQRRHRSLVEVVQWSLDLLTELERIVFRRVAIFEGGFTAAAARSVTAFGGLDPQDVDASLRSLAAQSLIEPRRLPHGTRYQMLATIRSVALEQLKGAGEIEDVRQAHLGWVLDWSTRATPDDVIWWFPHTIELANQRSALAHAVDRDDHETAAALLAATTATFAAGGARDEVAQAAAQLRQHQHAAESAIATQLDASEMVIAEVDGDFIGAHQIAERVRRASDDALAFQAMLLMGHHLAAIDPPAAVALYDEIDARFGRTPMTSYGRGEAAITTGNYGDCVDAILRALAITDVSAVPPSTPERPVDLFVLSDLAVALHMTERVDEAHIVIDAMADAMRETSTAYSCVVPLLRAVVGAKSAPVDEMVELLGHAAALERQWSIPVMAYDNAAGAAMAALQVGRPAVAARAYAAIHGGPSRSVGTHSWRKTLRHAIRRELSDEARDEMTELGQADDPHSALAHVMEALTE